MSERLREVLRRGDPAGEETELSPAERQAMRRAVLSAAPEPRRSFRLVPVFTAGAAVVLSLVVALSLWRMHGPGPVPQVVTVGREEKDKDLKDPKYLKDPKAEQVAAAPAPAATPLAPAVRRRHPERRPREEARSSVTYRAAAMRVEPDTAPPFEEPPMRQVQFSTAGGTRIIWLLPETSRRSK